MQNSVGRSALIVLILGLLLSGISGITVYQLKQDVSQSRISADMKVLSLQFSEELRLATEAVHGLAAGMATDYGLPLSEAEQHFHYLSESVLNRHEKIQSVYWTPIIRSSDRKSAEQNWQAYFPDFQIYELTDSGVAVPARQRSDHFPVLFVSSELKERNNRGFDLASDSVLLQGIRDAVVSGRMTISGPVSTRGYGKTSSSDADRLVLLIQPVFDPEAEDNISGLLSAFISVRHLMKEVLSASKLTGLHVQLTDQNILKDSVEADALLFRQLPASAKVMDMAQSFLINVLPGYHWLLTVTPSEEFMNERKSDLAYVVTLTVLILTAIAASYVRMSERRQLDLEQVSDARYQELRKSNKELVKKSQTDDLTGIANRHTFDHSFDQEWKRTRREHQSLSLVLFDLDDFDSFNQHKGRLRGDECLRNIAEAIRSAVNRPGDLLARYGGDQFVLLLPNTPDSGASMLARQCCQLVESIAIPHHQSSAAEVVTISAGVCSLIPDGGIDQYQMMEYVAQAMRQAKQKGKNRVESIDPV
ncbi:diguanylate cyclase domain-containing protein [Oceanospirillum sediminis]|uniref:diguanylate cyclase n=1 Tax=Oceanospirillum sediminis TaxID=2760088 RepID=A0A839IRA5_9GAMM|nr:diguanylate cyclase [Oceanospirillum sediminis]MBB1487451.1 diguanylate cyclase [Oceanospirillum sediminis]